MQPTIIQFPPKFVLKQFDAALTWTPAKIRESGISRYSSLSSSKSSTAWYRVQNWAYGAVHFLSLTKTNKIKKTSKVCHYYIYGIWTNCNTEVFNMSGQSKWSLFFFFFQASTKYMTRKSSIPRGHTSPCALNQTGCGQPWALTRPPWVVVGVRRGLEGSPWSHPRSPGHARPAVKRSAAAAHRCSVAAETAGSASHLCNPCHHDLHASCRDPFHPVSWTSRSSSAVLSWRGRLGHPLGDRPCLLQHHHGLEIAQWALAQLVSSRNHTKAGHIDLGQIQHYNQGRLKNSCTLAWTCRTISSCWLHI